MDSTSVLSSVNVLFMLITHVRNFGNFVFQVIILLGQFSVDIELSCFSRKRNARGFSEETLIVSSFLVRSVHSHLLFPAVCNQFSLIHHTLRFPSKDLNFLCANNCLIWATNVCLVSKKMALLMESFPSHSG